MSFSPERQGKNTIHALHISSCISHIYLVSLLRLLHSWRLCGNHLLVGYIELSIKWIGVFLIVSFQFDDTGIYWMWENHVALAIILGIMSLLFGAFWFKEQRNLK